MQEKIKILISIHQYFHKIFVLFSLLIKGQEISEGHNGFFNSPTKKMKNPNFCPNI